MGYLLSYWIMNVSVVSKRQNDSKWQKRRRGSRELSFICQLDGQEAILAPFRSRLTKKHVSVQNPGKPLCTEQPKDPASYAMSVQPSCVDMDIMDGGGGRTRSERTNDPRKSGVRYLNNTDYA